MLRYYVINLPQCQDRKERLERRLRHHGLLEKSLFIEAIHKDSPLLDWFQEGIIPGYYRSSRSEHACFLSHLKALRAFVDDPHATEAIILEDDAMFHNNFLERLEYVLEKKGSAPLLMLCFIAASWKDVKKVVIPNGDESRPSFYTITPKIFGAQAYWISKDYARLSLKRLDRRLRYLGENFVTSELITRLSQGYFVSPPLVIEEGVYSTLRQGNDLDIHRRFFSSFGLENYLGAEEEDIKSQWKPTGYNPLTS
jgi:GR25 family glycosyltransferase involved in LPS biosynthesis